MIIQLTPNSIVATDVEDSYTGRVLVAGMPVATIHATQSNGRLHLRVSSDVSDDAFSVEFDMADSFFRP
jgi:hypothetical protein